MMSARTEILGRVRAAVTDVSTETGARSGKGTVDGVVSPGAAAILELFAENVADYQATVVRVPPAEVAAAIWAALDASGCRSVVVPTGLDPAWRHTLDGQFEVIPEAEATPALAGDTVDAVVTASAIGIATTGTIVLDHGPDQGRRELTLIPDTHICVIGADQLVHDVPEAVTRLRPQADSARPLTWISGPSATSDIELQRVEGVHGPRTLVVVVITAPDENTATIDRAG